MTEPNEVEPESGPRIRAVGLVLHAAMSDARREAVRREEEKERKAAEFAAELRADADVERTAELLRRGDEPHSVDDVLQRASFGMDREDAAERRREREAAVELGRPIPEHLKLNKYQMKREPAEREAAKETAPASQADLGRLEQAITGLKSKLHALGGKPRDVR